MLSSSDVRVRQSGLPRSSRVACDLTHSANAEHLCDCQEYVFLTGTTTDNEDVYYGNLWCYPLVGVLLLLLLLLRLSVPLMIVILVIVGCMIRRVDEFVLALARHLSTFAYELV